MSYHLPTDSTQNSGKKTLHHYVIGFGVAVLLTISAFSLIEMRLLNDTALYISLTLLALTQFIVQSVCFLRLNTSPQGRWNLLPYLFMILIVIILMGGSLWIMYNLNYNMVN